MRHLFGKEHKERKSKRLVKKLQRQEDKNWHIEQQRRLEQEEKDAALARELQDEVAPDEALINTSDTNATASTPISPTVSSNASAPSPISSPPPPIPLKPAAYYSGLSTSSSSSSNGDQQLWSQETLLLCNSTSSSSSTSQRTVPPPPYQNGQPPLPPRERSISQLSQYNHTSTMQETDACIAYDAFPNFIAASESIRPDPSQLIQRCDPSMFIIPPLHKQPKTTTTCSNPLYPSSAMCMPETEPVGSAPFQCFTTPPYNHTHSTSATAVQAPINQYVPNPTPSISTTISHHSLQGTGIGYSGPAVSPYVSQNATTATATTTMSPCASNHSQLTSMKPDAKPEEQDESDSRSAFPPLANIHQPITAMEMDPVDDSEDDDDSNGSMFWECNDGRMMTSAPSKPHTINATHDNVKINVIRQVSRNGKHLTAIDTNEINGNNTYDDRDTSVLQITNGDNVINHQYDNLKTSSRTINNNTIIPGNTQDPFADCFAVNSNVYDVETANVSYTKPHFKMNAQQFTTAKMHDPLTTTNPTKPASALSLNSTN